MKRIKDKIMRALGFEKIENIKITKDYTLPRKEKLVNKARFFNITGECLEKVVINKNNELLDGYTTLILIRASGEKYIKVIKINMLKAEYQKMILGYKVKKEKEKK